MTSIDVFNLMLGYGISMRVRPPVDLWPPAHCLRNYWIRARYLLAFLLDFSLVLIYHSPVTLETYRLNIFLCPLLRNTPATVIRHIGIGRAVGHMITAISAASPGGLAPSTRSNEMARNIEDNARK